MLEPVLEWYGDLAEVILLEHIFVPDHQLNDSKLIGKGEIQRIFESGILWIVDRVACALGNRCLVSYTEDRNHDESGDGDEGAICA